MECTINNCTANCKQVAGRIAQLPTELLLTIVSHATLQSAVSLTLVYLMTFIGYTCPHFHAYADMQSISQLTTLEVILAASYAGCHAKKADPFA